jgi:HSP20 family protein
MRYDIEKRNRRENFVDKFFNDFFFDTESFNGNSSWTPAVDIIEEKDKYLVKADLPGLEEKDVDLELKDGYLTIRGERKNEYENKEGNVYRCEKSYGSFMRTFNVNDVDADKVNAEYKNGILTINLPKAESKKAKKISIKKS